VGQERLPWELLGDLCGCSIPAHDARPRIEALRAAGLGPTAIAHRLNVDGVRTPSGRGRWRGETVVRHVEPERWAAYMREYRRRRTVTG
jgi:hypothetical protein